MKIKALLYPHTYIRMDLASLVFSFIDSLVLLQPSEKTPDAPWTKLLEKGLIQIITPPPFGKKLVWFEQLVKSYEEWGLMMRWPENVSIFKSWPEAVEETVSEIKAELLGKKKPQQDDPILRARVILQLAYNLDKRLEELDQEYEILRSQATRLTEFILGQELVELRFPKWVIEGQEPNWILQGIEERIKAYALLIYLVPEIPNIILTDQIGAKEELIDACEKYQKLGSMAIEPVPWEELSETIHYKNEQDNMKKIKALLNGNLEESSAPRVEAWKLYAETKSLLSSVYKSEKSLKPGETILFYIVRT